MATSGVSIQQFSIKSSVVTHDSFHFCHFVYYKHSAATSTPCWSPLMHFIAPFLSAFFKGHYSQYGNRVFFSFFNFFFFLLLLQTLQTNMKVHFRGANIWSAPLWDVEIPLPSCLLNYLSHLNLSEKFSESPHFPNFLTCCCCCCCCKGVCVCK